MPIAQQPGLEWRVGDKALYECKVVTIQKVEPNGRVSSVTDGLFDMGGGRINEHLFPVSEGGKEIASFFESQCDELHKLPGTRLLNWPSLAAMINVKFDAAMRDYHNTDMKFVSNLKPVTKHIMEATLFFHTVRTYMQMVTEIKVEGFPLFAGWV